MTDRRGAGERLYRALLYAYPGRFRSEYGEELLELFRYRRDVQWASHNRLGTRFWGYIAKDMAGSVWREWRHPIRSGRSNQVRTNRGGDRMKGWIDDLRYAARRLARSPGFAATALMILVLGIGVNSTAFSVVNALLFQAPPFEEPERVVLVLQDSDGGTPSSTSYPAYVDMTRIDGVFEAVSAFTVDQAFLEQDDVLLPITVEYATSSYMSVVGLAPSLGIWFDALADDPTGPPLAVITHKMWTGRLGSDPAVLGSTLRIGGSAVTVVGVGPRAFNGGAGPASVDMWLSISAMRPTGGRAQSLTRRFDHPFYVRARLASGVSVAQASSAMDNLAGELARTYPEANADRGIAVLPVLTTLLSPQVDAGIVPGATLTMVVVVLVLLIGTLNLANLLLVRCTVRAREMAVRLALGAGRIRLVRTVLSEALLLAALGGAGGLALATWVVSMAGKYNLDFGLPLSLDVRLDGSVLLFTLLISVGTGLVFGLVPALRTTSREVAASLTNDGAITIGARRRFGLTGLLVAGQVAMSLLLLAVASVFLESLARAQGADPGFAWENTAYVRMSIRPLALEDEAATLLYQRLEERLEALPEVGRATLAVQLPAAMRGTTTLLLGSALDGVDSPTETPWNLVTRDYFDVMGIPVLHGRTFSEDDAAAPPIAIISAAMARTYWGRTDVVGETYRSEAQPDSPVEIVGVVGDVSVRSLGEAPTPSLYWLNPGAVGVTNIIFEAETSAERAIPSARAAIQDIDSRILILGSSSMRDHLGDTLERQRIVGTVLGGLGAVAMLVAILGVYGVVSFAVSRRRSEIGIRIALGAGRGSVVGLFVRDASAVVIVGSLVGLALSIPVGRLVAILFTGSAPSLLATVGVAALLMGTALAATVVPAARAARTDPTDALRQE